VDALRLQQQLDGLKNMRLIVGDENTDWFLLTGDDPPPLCRLLRRRSKLRGLRKPGR
jgi:hypothetical protein